MAGITLALFWSHIALIGAMGAVAFVLGLKASL